MRTISLIWLFSICICSCAAKKEPTRKVMTEKYASDSVNYPYALSEKGMYWSSDGVSVIDPDLYMNVFNNCYGNSSSYEGNFELERVHKAVRECFLGKGFKLVEKR
jgi:hypothetical protein